MRMCYASSVALQCILCGTDFTSEIEAPAEGEHHVTMVCAAHAEGTLLGPGKNELWGGEDLETSPALFEDRDVRIVEAWLWSGFGRPVRRLSAPGRARPLRRMP